MSSGWVGFEDDDRYEVAECAPGEQPGPDTEVMVEVVIPRLARLFRRKVQVRLWLATTRKWHLVAKFVSPHAAVEYAQHVVKTINGIKNDHARLRQKAH